MSITDVRQIRVECCLSGQTQELREGGDESDYLWIRFKGEKYMEIVQAPFGQLNSFEPQPNGILFHNALAGSIVKGK